MHESYSLRGFSTRVTASSLRIGDGIVEHFIYFLAKPNLIHIYQGSWGGL